MKWGRGKRFEKKERIMGRFGIVEVWMSVRGWYWNEKVGICEEREGGKKIVGFVG
jgi:hypothetical protein